MPVHDLSPGTFETQRSKAFVCHSHLTAEGSQRLVMAGELDLAATARAHERVRRAQDDAETVVCDLGGVSFIDVAGIRVLVDAADYARRRGTRLAIENVPAYVSRVLSLLSLDERLGTGNRYARAS